MLTGILTWLIAQFCVQFSAAQTQPVLANNINATLFSSLPTANDADVTDGTTKIIRFDAAPANPNVQVAAVAGEHNVSGTGGMNYSIPIQIPAGTNGMQPNLQVSYNSQSGNGLMGQGWSFSGLSAIARVNKDVAHDAWAGPIKLDANDALALDGNRLMLTSGVYGAVNSTYATENEIFSIIILKGGALDNAASYFEVVTKSGMTIEYGKANNAAFMSNDGTKPLFWRINKTIDPFGNYITYNYTPTFGTGSDREGKLLSIDYTGNSTASPAITPYQRITFSYTTRTIDPIKAYIAGSSIESNSLLTAVTINDLSGATVTPFHVYEFIYASVGSSNLNTYNTNYQLKYVREQVWGKKDIAAGDVWNRLLEIIREVLGIGRSKVLQRLIAASAVA